MYRASIDEGLGDKEMPIELNEYKQVTTLRRLHTMAKDNHHLRRKILMKGTKSFNDGSIKQFLQNKCGCDSDDDDQEGEDFETKSMQMMRKEIEGNVKYEEWKEYEAELER